VRRLWIDAQVGLAGDMLLAALLDAGADLDAVRHGLGALGLDRWSIEVSEVRRGVFRALRADVRIDGAEADARFQPVAEGRGFGVRTGPVHAHGDWASIRARITGADLPERVRTRALAAYGRLAEAEARLHGVPIEEIHLHEVGSVDAVIDIVGCCLALESLGIDEIGGSPVPLGTGALASAHGALPLPAPATLEVLRGWPVFPAPFPGEWVPPTGAALLAGLGRAGPPPAGVVRTIGHGAGRRDPPEVANFVRALILDGAEESADDIVEIACNLDDQPAVTLAAVPDLLFAAGALDVWFAPVQMKKGRPGMVLHALAHPAQADRLADLVLRHTTTLGVRKAAWTRRVLDRWFEAVETPWGPVRVKVGGRGGDPWHATPETDDVLEISRRTGIAAGEVARVAMAAWRPRADGRAASRPAKS
jgi:uncharacterized protein (TIGR00299 family) protein